MEAVISVSYPCYFILSITLPRETCFIKKKFCDISFPNIPVSCTGSLSSVLLVPVKICHNVSKQEFLICKDYYFILAEKNISLERKIVYQIAGFWYLYLYGPSLIKKN